MVDRVKELLQIHINCKQVSLLDVLAALQQCPMTTTVRTEAVAHLAELRFIKHLKHLTDGLLYSTVNYRRDAKPTFLPICLGDFHSTNGIRFVSAFKEGGYKLRTMLLQVSKQVFSTHSVYSTATLVTLHFLVSSIHIGGRENKLQQSVRRTGKGCKSLFAYPHEGLQTGHNLGFHPTIRPV